ncbi:uncharacterized protein LOC124269370 [Haliotis rubra]|uniref:uncharacterized protein LOC124269370 n=1 Tax=Haliotis rubra TaxID=36100 RepID=UPI001EE4EE91|nr:uncharacterized protein LOC124269370 [Haliotis rubra]
MSSKETTRQGASESSTQMILKAYFDEDGVLTVDFPHTEQTTWSHATRWTYTPSYGKCKIVHTREVQEYLCQLMRSLNRLANVTLASLHNPEGKVILVFKHATLDSAFNTILEFLDVRNRVLTFLHNVQIPVEDMKVSVQYVGINQPTEQDVKGNKSIIDWTPNHSPPYKAETQWVCKSDSTNILTEDEAHKSHLTRFKEDICQKFRAFLRRVSTGSVIFTFHHEHTEDALEMVSKHREVTAMILECLHGIDSTVTDIQIQVQLQDFIDPRSLPEHGDQDKRYVDKQEHDNVVKDLSEQVATLTLQLQEMKEKERAQLADIWLWKTRPGSPQPSESSGICTSTNTMTDVGVEEFQDTTDLSEPEDGRRQKGGASNPQHTSGTITDVRRQPADTRQELKATKERMHRLEIAHRKAWRRMEARRPGPTQKSDVPATIKEGDTRKYGTRSRPDTRATPTPARRDARADADLHAACREGNLAEVKRILDTGRADINCRGVLGMTPVMEAAQWGHRDVVEFLVSRGADVSLVDDDGDNTLHWACRGGDRKTVEFVLSLDELDINSRGDGSWTPVMRAAWLRHRDMVKLLVSRGADVSLVDDYGDNTLHWACVGGDREIVEFVLSLDGMDINARNNDGKTAADVARDGRRHQLSDLLVSRGTQ